MANNITHSNWADYFATTPTDWTIDNTNRIYEYTGTEPDITFDVNFDDTIPVTLIIPRISQQSSNISIRIHNATIYFFDGAGNFSGGDTNTFSGPGVGATNTTVDIEDCIFIASNGGSSGFGGSAGRADRNTTGAINDCTFHGINTGTAWFVNTAGIPAVSLVGNTYNQSALHSAEFSGGDLDGTPSVMTGIFDGTTRENSGGQYTLRRVGFDTGVWAYHTDCTLAGTGYRTTAGTANNQPSIYQTNETAADQIEFSLNNQIESSNYSFQKTNAATLTLYEGYTWNPVFVDRITSAGVTDMKLTHVTAFSTVPRVFTAPTTVDFATVPTATTNGALVPASGYIIHTGEVTASTANRIATTDKALDFATGAARDAHTYNMTGKSYTHNQSTDTISTVVNRITDSSTGDFPLQGGNWEYVTEDTHNLTADSLVEGVTEATARTQNPNTLGGIYQSVKVAWYDLGTDTDPLGHHLSVTGVSLVLEGVTSYTHSVASRTVDLLSEGGFDFNSAGTTAISAGDGLDNIDLNGNTLELGNGDTVTFPILDGGTDGAWQYATGVTLPSIVADTSGALEGILTLPQGTYRINNADVSNLTINGDGTGQVIMEFSGTTGDATLGADGSDVIEQTVPLERDYVVPAQVGNFIVRQTGLADTAANIKQEEITSSSTLADRTFTLLSNNPDSYQIYWKPASSNSENEGYSITHIGPVTGSDVTANETVNISNTTIADVLYEFDIDARITTTWDPDSNAFQPKGPSDAYSSIVLSVSGASTSTVDGGTTLAGFLQAANHIDYLRTVAVNYLTGSSIDIIGPASASSTNIDNRYITLTSSGAQQLLQGLVFTGPSSESLETSDTGSATVNLVSNSPNPDGITIGEVRTATNEALDTNPRLQETENGIAYMLSDGSTSPVLDSRLAGIRPKSANYDSDTDYTQIFDE